MRTIFPRPLFSWSLGQIKKQTSRISYKLALSWRRVLQTKSRQTLVFDPGGSTGRLRTCPFSGTWRELPFGEFFVRALDVAGAFFERMKTSEYHSGVRCKQLVRIAVGRCFSAARLIWGTVKVRRHAAMGDGGTNGCQTMPWSEELGGKKLHGAADGDLEPRESDVSCTSSTRSTRLSSPTSVVLY